MSRAVLVVLALSCAAACEISNTDPLPDIGANCTPNDPKCGVEHTCRPTPTGQVDAGLCAPVLSYGICDEADPVTHSPGREGTDEDREDVLVDEPADVELLDNVRSVTGLVRVFKQGGERVALDDLCGLKALQRTGGGMTVGNTDLTNLDGLQSLTSVGAGLVIVNNPGLTSLDALANMVDVGTRTIEVDNADTTFDVVIAANSDLPQEAVDAFVSGLEARSGKTFAVVACGNDGDPCAGDDVDLVQLLVATGGALQ